ncbi:uroporphyrinogen-III C-methyltransferase [Hyphomicrobium sp.]|uniref:uroporphyrinogen-III C-methyltransferase n=1 Tax=Hyphomicrobium sp. TaxID=82 RepID=UPI0025BF45F3|nr:uroporphyrinogen-III C-methyltransferase [Hyphomicrobium sp.]MCC7251777.1 uroporphyrinogen-III C-methyltransferase [Hyphomicrobium sp.]
MTPLPDSTFAFPEFAPGEVWLVGAGPGDPRLLTLFAVHALQQADEIFYDALLDARILRLAKPEAILTSAGKRGGKPSPHQSDINIALVESARQGRRVVRLKGGDPFVFGRGAEEVQALAEAGIRVRIVPGISAGLAGPALAGIPATVRTTNHAVILATGHRVVDAETLAEWEKLARTGQPIILFMAMSRLAEIANAFQRGGLPADTPAAIIENATTDRERVVETSLGALAEDAATHRFDPPAIVVIGKIVTIRRELQKLLAHWHL